MVFEEDDLNELKKKMNPQQIRKVAQIVQAEVKRRENMKSQNNSNQNQLAEMYEEIDEKMRQNRLQKEDGRSRKTNYRRSLFSGKLNLSKLILPKFNLNQSTKNIALLAAVIIFASLKIFSISGSESMVSNKAAEVEAKQNVMPVTLTENKSELSIPPLKTRAEHARARLDNQSSTNPGEQQLLMELDARRTELEKKAQNLEEKEIEIKNQSQALAEKLAELKTLTSKIQQVRIEKDNQYEARLEQLSQVYGSIAPNEAAPMLGKLDDETALALLKRMPSKRMGQILSQMDPQRAVDLTKSLTAKDKLDDLPAK